MTAPDAHNRSTPGNAPVTAPETDALDAWLESITSPRHGEQSRDIPGRRHASNGHVYPGTTLESVAKQFHTRLTIAERAAEPDVPADAIWEKIMVSTTSALTASTPLAPRRAAELVSAHPRHSDRSRTIPAWVSGSHWAVSAFMVAAVVVGIVALYGSFAGSPGPDEDPATNPNFAMASPGETVTTPEPDIDRWLVDPATIDCERDPNRSIDWSEVATDRPKAVENYLPFASAGASEAEAIADHSLLLDAGCAPTDADPIVTDDFGWMPGVNGGVIPTDEQVAIAQKISAALPMQDYASYFIIREQASGATPEADAEPTGRPVLLPQDIVQLPDGRLGGPLRTMIETNDPNFAITDLTQGYEAAGSAFLVFEQVNGRWLYDELFLYCVGDCDWFWAEIASPDSTSVFTTYATPAGATPSADAAWLQPYAPDECDVTPRTLDEAAAFMRDSGEWAPRQYGPVSPVTDELAREVARANRVFQSCDLTGETGEWRAMVSPRLIFEGKGSAYFDSITNRSPTYEEFVANHRELSELLLTDPTKDYTVDSPRPIALREGGLPDYSASEIFWPVMLPDDLVMLPDGRIGGPQRELLPANHEEFQQAVEEVRLATPTPLDYEMVNFLIYVEDPTQDGQWVLDETLTLCASNCDAFYADAEEFYQSNVPIAPATPAATLAESSPSASTDWLAPIAPDECDVEARSLEEVAAFIEDPGETVPRDYAIVGPAEPATAAEVSSADRVWRSCSMYEGAAERRAMESPRSIHQESPNALADVSPEEQQATYRAMRYLSEEVISQDYLDYRIDSDTFRQEIDAIMPGEITQSLDHLGSVIVPDQVVTFADGRLGGPVSIVRNPFPEGFDPEVDNDYWMIEFHIYSQDPARDGAWVLDQRLDLCIGKCDVVWTAYELEYGPTPSSLATPIAATPTLSSVASPAASTTTLQPISADECVVDPVSEDELSAIVQDPDGEVERSYAPTGPVDDALAQDVAGANRAWQSCYVYGTAGERAALQSARLTRDGPGVQAGMGQDREDLLAELEHFDASRELGDMMLTGDWRDYLIESDLFVDPVTGVVQTVPDFIPTIPIPEQALHLTDGRIAIPIVMLVPPGTYPFSTEDVDDIPYGWIQVHILTQDPTRDGRWVMDEEIFLCTGDCDVARAKTVEYIDYLDSLVPYSDDATPAATPQARRDGQAA